MAKKTNWGLIGGIAGACLAPFTGGATLAWTAVAAKVGLGFAGGKVLEGTGLLDSGSNSNDNNVGQNLEAWKTQMQGWQDLVKARAEEAKRLREEMDEEKKKLTHNSEEITRLTAVINNPHSSEEEKSNARKRIVLLEDENKELRGKLDKINGKLDELSKTPPAPNRPWNWPQLKTMDKLIIAGGMVLLVYLIIPENKKK